MPDEASLFTPWGIAAAAGSSILSAIFGDPEEERRRRLAKQQKEAIDKAITYLQRDIISESGKAIKEDKVSDVFNSTIVNSGNTLALTHGNVINKAQFTGASIAPLISQKAQAIIQEGNRVDDFNTALRDKITNLRFKSGSIDTSGPSFGEKFMDQGLPTGLSVLQLGAEIGLMDKRGSYLDELIKKLKDQE